MASSHLSSIMARCTMATAILGAGYCRISVVCRLHKPHLSCYIYTELWKL